MTSVLIDQWLNHAALARDGEAMQLKLLPFVDMASDAVDQIEVQLLKQKPKKRMVLAYQFKGMADQPNLSVVGKLYCQGEGEQVYREMSGLWASGFTAMPKPLGYLPELNMVVQAAISGQPLGGRLLEADAASSIRQFAQTLAAFHNSTHRPEKAYDLQQHLMRCHPSYDTLVQAMPEAKAPVDTLIQAASQIMADKTIPMTPIHADLHLKQAHGNRDGCWLLDFDSIGWGDPAADLGNLIVFFKGKSRKVPQVDRLIEAFLETYFQHMDAQISQRIPLYEALTHLRRACKQYRLQQNGWENKVHHMLNQAVRSIDLLK